MEHNILWFRIAVISTFYKNPGIQKKIFLENSANKVC